MADLRPPGLLLSLCLLLAAATAGGCGSSTTRSGTTTHAAGAETGGKTAGGSGLKVIGTPNFAKPSSSEPVRTGTVQVSYQDITIRPDTLRVKAGTTVVWTNRDPVAHNVTSVSGPQRVASSNFGEGASFSVKLTHPGTIHYECTNHPATMNGTIEVLN